MSNKTLALLQKFYQICNLRDIRHTFVILYYEIILTDRTEKTLLAIPARPHFSAGAILLTLFFLNKGMDM